MRTKFINPFILFFLLVTTLFSEDEIYQKVRVYYSQDAELHEIHELGIPLDHVLIKKGVFVELTATLEQATLLQKNGFQVEIIQSDLTKYYQSRFDPTLKYHRGFELGSMGGNYTLEEMELELDSLHMIYPDLVSEKMNIGTSLEGRTIWAVKVSDNVDLDENTDNEYEPEVLYTGVTHAREPVGMMNQIYFMYHLCENYGSDALATYLVDNREIWFVPVINPDGYVYNESMAPNGGGMHRKNLRPGCPDNPGVDLNRNYSYNWGLNDEGSSGDPCSSVYRGEGPFSEPATQTVRDFVEGMNFKNILHYHAYGNLLIHSFGTGDYPIEPNLSMLREFGAEMTKYNGYEVGTGMETVGYPVNGDAVDWSYGGQGLVSYTPEIGSYNDGFWPATDRIIPLCEENVWPNLFFAKIAGTVLEIRDINMSQEFINPGDLFSLTFDIMNVGLRNSLSAVIIDIIEPLNDLISFDFMEVSLGEIESREQVEFLYPIEITVDDNAGSGCETGIIIHMADGEPANSNDTFTDTIYFIIGEPEILIYDGIENGMDNWTTGYWGISDDAADGDYSITDSPSGDYSPNTFNTLEWSNPIDLSDYNDPVLTFKTKWEIENRWDFAQVQGSIDGVAWVALEGNYTKPGSGYGVQPENKPGYDGFQSEWVDEEILLSQFVGETDFRFRFVIMSDSYVEEDGIYIDEISISSYPTSFLIGDVNQDCTIDIADIMRMIDIILYPGSATQEELDLGDINHDFSLDIFDILLLVALII